MKGIIYKWTCNVNGKSYIGQTINEEKREKEFWNKNDAYTTKGSRIDCARKLYGLDKETWTKTILKRLWCRDGNEYKLKERLDYWEKYYINKYDTFNNGYNLTNGGETNKTISKQTKKKLSDASIRQWENYSNDEKNDVVKKLHNGAVDYHNKNKNHVKLEIALSISEKQKKIHKNNITRNCTPKILASSRKVAKLDDVGNILEVYNSITEASEKNNVYKYGITMVCKGVLDSCKGYKWKYLKEYDDEKPPKGYHWDKKLKRWCARIKFKQKSYTLGFFKNEETANEIYKLAKEKIKEGIFLEWVENKIEEKYKLMKKMGEI